MASSSSDPENPSLLPVEFTKGVNGLDKVILREASGFSAEVYLYGAHVTSWKNENREELLFVSSKAIFDPPKPIFGGIPIYFPQFSSHGILEAHVCARNRVWCVDPNPPPLTTSSRASVDLLLKPSEEDLKFWSHSFEFRLRVTLGPGGDLKLTSRIQNVDSKPFSFTFAYHTYFSVSDISKVRVEGLKTFNYLDNLKHRERFTEQDDSITFEGEIDKVYLSTCTKIQILDLERNRRFTILKEGLPDAVVWNPWDKKAKALAEFGDDEYTHMLCVEAAAIEKPISLEPGEKWIGKQKLFMRTAVRSSRKRNRSSRKRNFEDSENKRLKKKLARKAKQKDAKVKHYTSLKLENQSDGDKVTCDDVCNAEEEYEEEENYEEEEANQDDSSSCSSVEGYGSGEDSDEDPISEDSDEDPSEDSD